MAKLSLILCLLLWGAIGFSANFSLKVLSVQSLSSKFKAENKLIGGLSGCVLDKERMYFVSDDRGEVAGSRIVSFPYDLQTGKFDFLSGKNILIKKESDQKILDLEGIAILPNGDFLLSSEGDLNRRPRVLPQIFSTNRIGKRTQVVKLPDEFVPEKSGQQTKGIQNNLAFEGLNVDPQLKTWGAFLEGPLLQKPKELYLIEGSTEKKFLEVEKNWAYPIPSPMQSESLQAYLGVTDFLYISQEDLLVLERGVEVSLHGISYQSQLCLAKKEKKDNISRECFLQINSEEAIKKEIPEGANFEGLCWVDQKKTEFMMVSDNNFSGKDKTYFVRFKVVEK